jgi:hypothetical protein
MTLAKTPTRWTARGIAAIMTLCVVLAAPALAVAQGSIFGNVQNANLTNPVVGQLLWVGFLDNTDEEIRIESSTGAGYDGTFWFDDFQNYSTEVAGNPYDFIFVNIANGQYFRLEKTIPNNSFQQEDVTLAAAAVPARPTGLVARAVSASCVNLTWNKATGVTYHVYRRATANNGVFRRLDDPSGNLANIGVADSFFVDATSDGATDYTYIIIGQTAGNIFSAHSVEVSVLASNITGPTLTAVNPNTGSGVGNPLVTLTGTDFDIAGAGVTFGGVPATNVTVVSPFTITCNAPNHAAGVVDVAVTNTASGLSSTLVGAFTYTSNAAPVLAAIGPRNVNEGLVLNFGVSATDADGTTPSLSAENLPLNATFTNNGNGTGTFNFAPDFTQAGVYNVLFIASDGVLADSESVAITVNNVNRAPILAAIGPRNVNEGLVLNFGVSASDPDATVPSLLAENLPLNATFVDNGNGTGTFNFAPDFTQAGVFNVRFIASDGALADSELVAITVDNVNRAPVLAAIGPQSVNEGAALNLPVSATDPDATAPTLVAENLPLNATFTDNGNGTGAFVFNPGFAQAGVYNVRFIASDGALADSELVAITVNDINQPPVLAPIGAQLINEGSVLNIAVSATDGDGAIPVLTAQNLPANASFVDNGNGTGAFAFSPNFTQSGVYAVLFIASDGVAADSENVTITVNEGGNQRPVLATIGAQTVNEGVNLTFGLSATDADSNPITLSALNVPTNAALVDNGDGTGVFSFDPDFTQAGVYNVTFIASDGLLADSEVVAITVNNVNRPPVLAAIGPRSVTEGQGLAFNVLASDDDGSIPALTVPNVPANANFVDNGNGTGTFTFNPTFAQGGLYQVLFIASDGVAADSELVDITVIDAGNQPPVLAFIGNRNIPEGQTLSFRVSASDLDGTIPTLIAENLPANATFADSLNGAGGFVFATSFAQGGNAYMVRFIASDGAAADTEVVFITVIDQGNLPPVFDPVPPDTLNEGDSVAIRIHAVDPEGGGLILGTLNNVPNAVFVDSGNGVGSLRFKPSYLQAGVDTVKILALDFGSPSATATLNVIFHVIEKNLPPNQYPIGNRTVLLGDSLRIRVVATDSTAPPGNQLFMAAINVPANANYADSGGGIGKFRFKPTAGQIGQHQVTFLVTDNGNPSLADYETITITVQNSNQPPVLATIGAKSVYEGDTLVFGVSATDPDGTIPILTTGALPVNAAFVDSGNGRGSLTFMPTYLQAGLYQVAFTASDGLLTDNENVLIQVREAGNQPPVLAPIADPLTVTEATQIITLLSATDPENQALAFSVSPLLPNAALEDSGNGRAVFRMTPDYCQDSTYFIRFIVSDASNAADTQLVQLIIFDGGNQQPIVADPGPQSVLEKSILMVNVSASDPDCTTPSLVARPLPPNSSFTDNGDGTGGITVSPDYPDAGLYNVYVVAMDAENPGLMDSVLVPVTILDQNRPPVIDSASTNFVAVSMLQGQSVTIWIKAYDLDGPAPVMSATGLRSYMSYADSGNGRLYITCSPDFDDQFGSFNITIVATDGDYDTTQTTRPHAFNIGPVNVPPVLEPIGSKTVMEGDSLVFVISATDANGTTPVVSALNLPSGATFTSLGGGLGRFRWLTTFTQAGDYYPLFRAQDVSTIDTERVHIQVVEAGNRAPVFLTVFPTDTIRLSQYSIDTIGVRAIDLDNPVVTLTVPNLPPNATFLDSLNNGGRFIFDPDATNANQVYNVLFVASDGAAADSGLVIYKILSFLRGDWNNDGVINVTDVVAQVNHTFRGAPPPTPPELGDYNGDATIDILDLVTLINYVFRNGTPLPP